MRLGIDFGTTNSALAVADAEGNVRVAKVLFRGAETSAYRSVIYFEPERREALTGPQAIEAYLDGDGSGRLIQSLKSYLASRLFQATSVFNRNYTIEELIAVILRDLRKLAGTLGEVDGPVTVGRPVRFAHAEGGEDDVLAVERLRAALVRAGFRDVRFVPEPVAASLTYARRLDRPELVLTADFGGGTSDFCLMKIGGGSAEILGTDGVGVAGDAFDARIIDHVVSPALGRDSQYASYLDKKRMVVPPWLYSSLRRWHHLSFLKSKETMHLLHEIHAQSLEPKKIDGLIYLVEQDLGYRLYEAVEKVKVALSSSERARLLFDELPVPLAAEVTRADFERWIAPELDQIAACADRLLARAGGARVDSVFMTGGSSFVPAVRRIFEERFGAAALRGGEEMTSIAIGLALDGVRPTAGSARTAGA